MKRIGTVAVALSALVIGGIGASPSAMAAPMGGSAADTVRWLEEHGYHVQLNGRPNGSLAKCVTTGVHGLRGDHADDYGRPTDASTFHTVHVDINCNNTV